MTLEDWAHAPREDAEPGVLGYVKNYLRENGNLPDGARLFVDEVEFTGTGDEFLNMLGIRDANVTVTIQLPPATEQVVVELQRPDGGFEAHGDTSVAPGEPQDRRVVACNFAEGTSAVAAGARCYVVLTNPGSGHDRIVVLARSRGGRWIETWRAIKKLRDFRAVTLPPEHPMYRDDRLWDRDADALAECLRGALEREAPAT